MRRGRGGGSRGYGGTLIGGRVIARAMLKDVIVKCYGGDAIRKRKLLEKRKEGEAEMREYGSVSIPQEALIAALRMGEE
jgi:GTP-binding protein LepA